MKLLCKVLAVLVLSTMAVCQAKPSLDNDVYAFGVSYNNGGSPAIAGTGLYAHLLSDGSGTYAFTVVDALPTSVKPFVVNTNIGAGVAQKVFTLGKVPIFIPTEAGISYNGTNTGWAWSTGGLASIKVKGNFLVMPGVRVLKSSVSSGSGYQPVVSLLFGWGQ